MEKRQTKKKEIIEYKVKDTMSKVEEIKKITDNFNIARCQYSSISRT